ncbi:MAG: NAD-dependent epimerase/dehydratase family protein [Kiritimatiellia bacterium]
MQVLVTGGAGFIGSHIVEALQGRARVRVLDDFRTGRRENLDGLDCELIEGSILDPAALARAVEGVDTVFHLAAMVSVPESMQNPGECVRINAGGTVAVLEAAVKAGVRKLVLSSTAAVYGDNPSVPKVESMTPEPMSPYAVTKLDGEYYCSIFQRQGRIETACLRFFNVFGPRQNPRGAYASAIPIFITRALRGEPLTIFGDGLHTRDFIYVKDIAAANLFAAATPGVNGVYNAGYGVRTTILDIAADVLRLCGAAVPVEHRPDRAGDVRHSLADASRLAAAGFRPAGSVAEGLRATVQWYRNNPGVFS